MVFGLILNSLQSIIAEIEGLGSVLCTIIDYKGIRYVGQSIIPGILNQGETGASLLYGVMEEKKPITVS